ncbi:hypothetical protein N7470_000176 [Penicillium chermesinum]|nr:hypothetical protein N7470_000176 [Penicillium chermesinum]
MNPPSPRPIASGIPVVGPSAINQIGTFYPGSQDFAAFRSLNKDGPHALQDASQAQDAMRLADNAHATEQEIALLQPDGSAFEQSELGPLVTDGAESPSFAGHLQGMKLVPNPPDLEYWRDKLFHVDETITLTEEQYVTYVALGYAWAVTMDHLFPFQSCRHRIPDLLSHVDNVYSHRSTQRPTIGTPKSDDPNKKKRKRTVRERDLCDVKIKITEYLPGYTGVDSTGGFESMPANLQPGVHTLFPVQTSGVQPFGVLESAPALSQGQLGANGKNDGVSGGHRHTLEESDRVKKNTVQRKYLKEDKQKKKFTFRSMPDLNQKTYHTKATGLAATTALNHSAENPLQLYGSCFCPFVQRVWIALEMKGISYQYIEIDPYAKPQALLEVNPRGLVPAVRHGDWGCYESSVIMEYLEDLNIGTPLLPADAKLRAHCRLWADHINRNIVPAFYRVLQEQDQQKQIENAQELQEAFDKLIVAADPCGPFFMGSQPSFVDIQAAPWVLRLSRVLKPYRGWPDPEPGTRWASWVAAINSDEHIQATTSTDELYLDSYERYAQNRPNTSLLANAINTGRSLP